MRKKNSMQIYMDISEIRSENSNFIILDRYSYC